MTCVKQYDKVLIKCASQRNIYPLLVFCTQ